VVLTVLVYGSAPRTPPRAARYALWTTSPGTVWVSSARFLLVS